MIILDFDHTLFNTQQMKQDFCQAAVKCGVTEDIFWSTFHQAYALDPQEPGTYSIEKHLTVLDGLPAAGKKQLQAALYQTLRDHGSSYLFPDVLVALGQLKQRHRLYLLTKGNENFQRAKIAAAGLEPLFTQIIIVNNGNKLMELDRFLEQMSNEPVININDHVEELLAAHQQSPHVHHILIRRSYQDVPIHNSLPLVRTLGQVFEYIGNLKT